MKKVYVSTEFSEKSDLALILGYQLAKQLGLELRGLHWDDVSARIKGLGLIPSLDALYKKIDETNPKVPAHIEKDLKAQTQRTQVDFHVDFVEGSEFESIAEYVHQDDEDLLVVSQSKKDFWGRFLFGSFAERAIFRTRNPVVLAKKSLDQGIKKIGLCFNPGEDNESVFNYAIELGKKLSCFVEVIHVEAFDSREIYKNVFATNTDPEKDKNQYLAYKRQLAEKEFEKYKEQFDKHGVECRINLLLSVDKTPAEMIAKNFTKDPVDLMIVEPNPGFLDSFKFNSTSYDLIKNVPTNFLILKNKTKGK